MSVLSRFECKDALTNTRRNLTKDLKVLERLRQLKANFFTVEETMIVVIALLPVESDLVSEMQVFS